MARIFIEIVKDADPYPINEEDFNIAFANAPSLDDEKMKVDEEYWGGTDQDRIMRRMYALDYYATVDFPKDLQDELVEALTNEMGDEIELIITVEPGLPSPNWAYRAMDTDYTMREAEAAWLPKKSKSNPAKNPASTCTGCGKAISGAYEAGSYTCSGCGAGVEVNPVKAGKNPSSNPLTAKKREDVERALENHEKLKGSYFWTPAGNASSRRNDEKKYNFGVKVEYKGDEYTYDSNVRVSVKNFYYTGTFRKNGKKGDVRIFKKLLTVK